MALPPKVDIGTAPNNGTGDPLRIAFQKLNARDGYLDVRIDSKIDQGGNTTDTGQSLRLAIDANETEITAQDVRIGEVEGLGLFTNQASQEIYIKNASGTTLSTLSVAFLNNEGTAFSYNDVTKKLELKNDQGDLLAEVPVSAFVGNLAANLSLNSNKLSLKDSENNGISFVEFQISNISGLQDALNSKEPKNVPPNANDKVAVFNSDGSKRYEDYGGGAASLLSKPFTYTGGAQTFTADFDIVQVDSLLVENTPLLRPQYEVSGTVVTIIDKLVVGAVIELNYWKANAVNATYYTKAEIDGKLRSMDLDPNVSSSVYGIEYDTTVAAPEVTRIGDLQAHIDLPLQSKMRRCLLDDAGTVNYYLDPNDSTLREDGTAADLTGAHGQVMVEIPRHWRKFETEGNIRRALVCVTPFAGAHEVPQMYISAYKAALHRPDNKLSSVVNNTADYRGGDNDATDDANAATLLGKPSSSISRINYRDYAQNRGINWYDMDYQARKTIYWLITIEYATRNHQTIVDNTLTAEGYRKGCLGNGPTDLSGGDWSTFSGYYPVYECGITNSLGNNTGEVPVVLQDFPTAGFTKATQANSYRGIENFFGDIWEWTNGVNIEVGDVAAEVFIPDNFGLKFSGNLAIDSGYVNDILFGKEGDILPVNTAGASSTTYFSDYYYQNFASKGLRGLLFGGLAYFGSKAGSACARSHYGPPHTSANIGSRLCFFVR